MIINARTFYLIGIIIVMVFKLMNKCIINEKSATNNDINKDQKKKREFSSIISNVL